MKIPQWKSLKLRHQFAVSFSTGIVVVACVLGGYLFYNQRQQLLDKAATTGITLAEQVGASFDFVFQELYDTTTFVFLNNDVRSLLENGQGYYEPQAEAARLHESTLSSLVVTKSYISTLTIYNDVGTPLYHIATDHTAGPLNARTDGSQQIFDEAVIRNGGAVWFAIDSDDRTFFRVNREDKVAMCRVLKNRNLSENIGYVVLTVNKSALRNICVSFSVVPPAYLQVQTADATTVYDSDKGHSDAHLLLGQQPLAAGEYRRVRLAGEDLMAVCAGGTNKTQVLYLFPALELNHDVRQITYYIFLLILLCLTLTLPAAYLISVQITKPMSKLLHSMRQFQSGDFASRVSVSGSSEFDVLGQGFNDMVENIDGLVKNNYLLRIKEREAEIHVLQSQINPHFLYNTLEMIYWEAVENEQKGIGQMVLSLSKLFRLSLRKNSAFTKVENEVEFIRHYLLLQKMRFGRRLEYRIDADDETLDAQVPRLMLQPLVENAILHGFEDKTDSCVLTVLVRSENEGVAYIIEDNGSGMKEEDVKAYLDKVHSPRSISMSRGYALSNIIDRLELIYADRYHMQIESAPDRGTRFSIWLPAAPEQMEEHT